MNPIPTDPAEGGAQARHLAALARGQWLIQHCPACDAFVYPPRALCPHCGAAEPDWVEPSGTGTVYAVTTVRRKPEAGGDYNVSLIDLDEGVRLMSRVEGLPPAEVRIGQRVKARLTSDGPEPQIARVAFDRLDAGPGQ